MDEPKLSEKRELWSKLKKNICYFLILITFVCLIWGAIANDGFKLSCAVICIAYYFPALVYQSKYDALFRLWQPISSVMCLFVCVCVCHVFFWCVFVLFCMEGKCVSPHC